MRRRRKTIEMRRRRENINIMVEGIKKTLREDIRIVDQGIQE